MEKKRYHHGDLRRKLLETTLQIISEEGLEKVSMRRLGQLLGVSRTAPYRHFSDKNDLLCAIAEEGYKRLIHIMNGINEQTTGNTLMNIRDIGIAYVEFATENPVHYRLMFGNEILENKRTSGVAGLAEDAFNEVLFAIKMCQDEKIIRPIDPYIIANTLWAMSHGISTLLNDGQIQTANAFKGLPALAQVKRGTGKANISQIYGYLTDILMNGFIA